MEGYVRNDPINLVDPDGRETVCGPGVPCWAWNPPAPPIVMGGGRDGSGGWEYADSPSPASDASAGPTVIGTNWPKWILSSLFNVDTSVSETSRRIMLSNAFNLLPSRINRSDCSSFLASTFDKLNEAGKLDSSMIGVGDLLQALNSAIYQLYAPLMAIRKSLAEWLRAHTR